MAELVDEVTAAEVEADGDAAYARGALTSAVGYAFALNPDIPPESKVDALNKTYAWVECRDGDELRALLESDEMVRWEFRQWVHSETALEPAMLDMVAAFDAGHDRGAAAPASQR